MKVKKRDSKAELLLLKDVDDLGRSGDIVKVKPGYAYNYLVAKRKAVIADANAKRIQDQLQEKRKQQAAQDLKESTKIKELLKEVTLKTSVKVDPDGHMYGSVSHFDIIKLLEEEGFTIERKMLVLDKPIKETGIHKLYLKLKEGIEAQIVLKINPEGVELDEDLTASIEPTSESDQEKASE